MTREEAIKELELIAKVTIWNERREAVKMAIEALKQPDTMTAVLFDGMSGSNKVGLQPVKHGEWIEGELYIKCSECGYPAGHLSDNYCSNCGAKMDKE